MVTFRKGSILSEKQRIWINLQISFFDKVGFSKVEISNFPENRFSKIFDGPDQNGPIFEKFRKVGGNSKF